MRGLKGLSRHKRLPSRLHFAPAGPCHLFHGALEPALHRGAVGIARRPTNAGQNAARHRARGRGMNSRNRLPRKLGQGVWDFEGFGTALHRRHDQMGVLKGGLGVPGRLRTVAMRVQHSRRSAQSDIPGWRSRLADCCFDEGRRAGDQCEGKPCSSGGRLVLLAAVTRLMGSIGLSECSRSYWVK